MSKNEIIHHVLSLLLITCTLNARRLFIEKEIREHTFVAAAGHVEILSELKVFYKILN